MLKAMNSQKFARRGSWLLGACGAIAFACLASLPWRPDAIAAHMPLTEDGYYSLSVARNLATGHGLTIDGVRWTNGFQPLFTLLVTPIYWLPGDPHLPLRALIFLHWLVHLATALVLGRIAQRLADDGEHGRTARFLAIVIAGGSMAIVANAYNGLETGFVLLLLAWIWDRFAQLDLTRPAQQWSLGVMLGWLTLARIDEAFLAIVLACYTMAFVEHATRPARVGAGARVGLGALLVSGPWWLYNVLCFGHMMPSSGTAQSHFDASMGRAVLAIRALTVSLVPWLPAGPRGSLVPDLLRLAIVGGTLWLALRAFRSAGRPSLTRRRLWHFAACLLVAAACFVSYYTLFGAQHFFLRYFAPVALPAVVAAALALARLPQRLRLLPLAFAAALCVQTASLAWQYWASPTLYTSEFLAAQVPLVAAHVPDKERVAAGQTGTLGYFRQAVVNLDGKVNAAALREQQHMWSYLEREGITWFCDWRIYGNRYLGKDPTLHGWHETAQRDSFVLWHRDVPLPRR